MRCRFFLRYKDGGLQILKSNMRFFSFLRSFVFGIFQANILYNLSFNGGNTMPIFYAK